MKSPKARGPRFFKAVKGIVANNWGLKLLALLLALVIYHTLKPDDGPTYSDGNDKRIFKY